MAIVKTAISLQESLFEQIEAVVEEMQISRSRFFALAAESFIQQHENQKLLIELNAAYDDVLDAEEQELLRQMRHKQFELVADEW
jgi:metal-responsive CopG/Arc/MetJ family transcriptional regulator